MADLTQRATDLRAKLEKDREVHQANLQATLGAIQAIDLLLAAPTETDPSVEYPPTPEPAQAAAPVDGLEVSTE